ncbi:MAG: TIGR04083 family peptide-modifying radical SAM enzyme, partial [Methanocorpusculum sp.]|nr:TIGR04083 family peptide-modifying radical SAM enzyme [Methanocorpusculum sp.]
NALAGTSEQVEGVDPHCTAYKRIFDEITSRMESEMAAGAAAAAPVTARMSRVRRKAKPGVMTLVKKIVEQ